MPRDTFTGIDELLSPNSGQSDVLPSLQRKIFDQLWPPGSKYPNNHKDETNGLNFFFAFFQREINTWRVSGLNVAIDTYRDFLNLVEHLRHHRSLPRNSDEIMGFFPPIWPGESDPDRDEQEVDYSKPLAQRRPFCKESAVLHALILTVRLWLMIDAGFCNITVFSRITPAEWPQDCSLDQLVSRTFTDDASLDDSDNAVSRWPKNLTAKALDHIGGFHIVWTSNIADHLLFNDDLEAVTLYHHAGVLRRHKEAQLESQVLPKELIEETLNTLALLLPRTDSQSRRWYKKCIKRADLALGGAAAKQFLVPPGRELAKYKYWRSRLTIIAEAYDSAEPKGLLQWWQDRRKTPQWFNFWLAAIVVVLTIVFGLIQSVTGIFQAYYSSHPSK